MNFEKIPINNNLEKETGKIEFCQSIELDENTKEFVSIQEKDIKNMVEEINNILGLDWKGLENEKISFKTFSEFDSFQDGKKKLGELDNKDNAYFFINSETGEKTILNYTPIPTQEEISEAIFRGYKENELKEKVKNGIMSGFSHEMAHQHPFFKNHGNDLTNNLWEQEQICSYMGEKARGDISNKLLEEGYITKESIDDFKLEDGNWDSWPKKEKTAVMNYFYPFLSKEFGLRKTRELWKKLQIDSDIRKGIKEIFGCESYKLENIFKQKIKDKDYLKNIFK